MIRPISIKVRDAKNTGPFLKTSSDLFWIMPVMALASLSLYFVKLPPLLENQKTITEKVTPPINIISMNLIDNFSATK